MSIKIYRVFVDVTENEDAYADHERLNEERDEECDPRYEIKAFQKKADAEKYVENCKKIWKDEKLTYEKAMERMGDTIYPPECYEIVEDVVE